MKISQNHHTHQPEHQEKTQHQTSSEHPYSPFIPILFAYLSCLKKYITHHEPITAWRPVLSAFSKVCVWPTPDKLSPTFQPRSSRKVLSFSKTSTFLKTRWKMWGWTWWYSLFFTNKNTHVCIYIYTIATQLQIVCFKTTRNVCVSFYHNFWCQVGFKPSQSRIQHTMRFSKVDERNPKQPPGMVLKRCKSWDNPTTNLTSTGELIPDFERTIQLVSIHRPFVWSGQGVSRTPLSRVAEWIWYNLKWSPHGTHGRSVWWIVVPLGMGGPLNNQPQKNTLYSC